VRESGGMSKLCLPVQDRSTTGKRRLPMPPEKSIDLIGKGTSPDGNGHNVEPRLPARRRAPGNVIVFLAGVLATLIPVALHNAAVSGEWSLSTFQAGPNFYIGNHPGAPGYYAPLVRSHETPFFEREDAERLAEQAAGRELSAHEVSQYWMGRTWSDIAAAPIDWLRLLWRKCLLLGNRYEIGDVESLYVYRDSSMILRALRFLNWGTLLPLSLLGMWITRRQWKTLGIIYALGVSMALAIVSFYVMARYRFPLVPLLIPLAAAALVQLYDDFRRQRIRRVVISLAALVVLAVPINWPVLDEGQLNALARMNVGVALAEAGEIGEATSYFAAAVHEHPGSAEAQNNLAQALAIQCRYGEAVEHYQAALDLVGSAHQATAGVVGGTQSLPGVWYNFGVALEHVGERERAVAAYRRALAEDPEDRDARAALRRIGADDAAQPDR